MPLSILSSRPLVLTHKPYLIAHGANPTITTNVGQTPLQTAERDGMVDVLEILRGYG